jgi:sec-independent protein translocase protein TatC
MTTHKTSNQGLTGSNQNEAVMGLWNHLDELRTRLIRSVLTLLVLFVFSLTFSKSILNLMKSPLEKILPANAASLHFTGPMDVFMVNIQIAMLAAIILGAPAWLYHFWKFLEPALNEREKKYVLPFIAATIVCFFLGIAFSYFFMLPLALGYLVGLGMEVAAPIITVTDYVSLTTVLLLSFGLVFETPVLLVLLAVLGIVSAETLAAQRRITFVLILVIAAIITPPDPISMLGMAIPCYLMYELSILAIRWIKPGNAISQSSRAEAVTSPPVVQSSTKDAPYHEPDIGL